MANRDVSKDVLKTVKAKTGKTVSEKDIYKIASNVKPSTVTNEAELRRLIKQVGQLVNLQVSDATVNEIIKAVKSSNLNPNNMEAMMKMMMGKK